MICLQYASTLPFNHYINASKTFPKHVKCVLHFPAVFCLHARLAGCLRCSYINILVDDSFPNEHLFSLSINTPWFADMENYLTTRKLPSHLSPHEKRKIITQSVNYSWVGHDLFRTGPDLIIRRCV
jgi:hypothetical protein